MKVNIRITDDNGTVYDGTLDLTKNTKNPKISIENKPETSQNEEITFNIPDDLIESIMKLDERQQIPILWSFSSQPVMSVENFITACSEKGFLLNPSWLPSAGGNFKNRLVKEDRKLTDAKVKIGGKKTWKLTDIGKIKIKKELASITKK